MSEQAPVRLNRRDFLKYVKNFAYGLGFVEGLGGGINFISWETKQFKAGDLEDQAYFKNQPGRFGSDSRGRPVPIQTPVPRDEKLIEEAGRIRDEAKYDLNSVVKVLPFLIPAIIAFAHDKFLESKSSSS